MNVCTCFLLFGTFAFINSSPVTTPREDKRRANLTLKSVQQYNVTEAKTVIGNKSTRVPHSTVETFTDFVQELVIILNTYNDDIFEDFFKILDKKIRKYHYRGCKFYELKGKHEFRSLLAEKLDLLTRKSVSEKRVFINERVNVMKLLNVFDRNVQELLDYINLLYKDGDKVKFRKILRDLKGYSAGYGKTRTRHNFVSLIKECIRATVFIHTDLKTNVRLTLRKLIANIIEFPLSTTSTTNFIGFKPTVRKPNTYRNNKARIHKIKEVYKRVRLLRPETIEASQEDETVTRGTSRRDNSHREEKKITNSSTNEAATEVMFYLTTEKPGIVYKFESKSKLVEKMLEEKSTGRPATGQSTTTQGLRLSSKKDLKSTNRTVTEVLDRDRRRTTEKEVSSNK